MQIALVYARPDGTIAQVWDDNYGAPENGTTLVARFDFDTYRAIYFALADNIKAIRFENGTIVLGAEVIVSAAWIAAREAEIVTNEQVQSAALVAVTQGKDYLRKQLLNPSPDVTTIYNALSTAVNANPYLLQMVNNQRQLMTTAHGWTIDTTTALGRVRYIMVIEQIIALLG